MTGPAPIDLDHKFPTLAKPPIVEAMITLVARARGEWTPEAVSKRITEALPDYPNTQHMNQARFSFAMQAGTPQDAPPPGSPTMALAEKMGWMGLRLVSQDQKQVVTTAHDSLSLSWLGDYVGWTKLSAEMMRVWNIHKRIAGIDSIDRIVTRYVNRLAVPVDGFDPALYFTGFGPAPDGMSRGPFLHQDTLGHTSFPKHFVNLVRTFEPSESPSGSLPLLVVLDAVNPEPFPADDAMISEQLREMHWLKNYAFFNSITASYQDLCK